MKKLTVLSICFALVFCLYFSSSAVASDEEASPQLLSFSYVQVKPGMELEFEELVKNTIPLFREWGVTEMDTFKISNFGMGNKYLFISPLMEPAALDAQLSEQSSNEIPVSIVSLISGISRTVVSAQDFMLITMPDLNIPAADDYEGKLFGSVTIGTASGSDEEFKKGIKKAISAIGKTDVKGVYIGKVGWGGNLDEYIMFILYDSFEEMVNNQTAIDMELAEADLASLDGVTKYRESEVLVRVPELCFEAAAE